ncbi:hypothetical protein H2199_006226 [Coniosporium tulheliwenetii]|uniref:Uncharacterized protein n=1 Tax=Coniosporium tulheliwenetii TaxID=3383036 RepID=A0ACC2YXB0_9PEZI|nr:hypothetical protein H2199_006226 [Cladosporium sp. JES 115]
MPDFKAITKSGWHPTNISDQSEGGWRSEFKGADQIAGWMGKKKGNPREETLTHQSAALSSLKDPASFGPPPKHINYHGAAAVPHKTTPDRSGLGAPLAQQEVPAQGQVARRPAQQAEEDVEEKPPPGPYRVDTTGLSTTNLPPPPIRRDAYTPPAPPAYNETVEAQPAAAAAAYANQGALKRQGNAGVSVPALGVGRTTSPPVAARSGTLPPPPTPVSAAVDTPSPAMNALRTGFSKLSTRPTPPSDAGNGSGGTTWAQKQAALNTANTMRNDPSKVSLSDARDAAATANNFRERHGEQAAAGWKAAGRLNQKYGVTDRLDSYSTTGKPAGSAPHQPTAVSAPVDNENPWANEPSQSASTAETAYKRAPPPLPVPRKKPDLATGSSGASGAPPPIPLGSKPGTSGFQKTGQKTIYAMPPSDGQDFGG